MSNTLEYIIKLRDQFSTGLFGIASRSNRTFNDINRKARMLPRSIDQINRRLDQLQKARRLSVDLSQIRRADREIAKLKGELRTINGSSGGGSILGGGNAGTIGMLGRYLAPAAIGAAAYRGVGFALRAGAERQTARTGLQTFLGGDTNAAMKSISNDAARTPFDFKSLLMVNRSLISSGVHWKEAKKDALALGNAISASGGGNDELSRMAANMQQIRTVGKATAIDIKQFGMAGINIYKLLTDATGKSVDQVKKMDVSYEVLSRALRKASEEGGIYFGAMEAQSRTLQGRWSTMWDKFKNDAASSVIRVESLLNKLMGVGERLGEVLGWAMKSFASWMNFGTAKALVFHSKVMQFVSGIKNGFGLLLAKIYEVVDLGLQKANNLGTALWRLITFDFKGAKDAWNKKEASGYTNYYEQQKNHTLNTAMRWAGLQQIGNRMAYIAARGGDPFGKRSVGAPGQKLDPTSFTGATGDAKKKLTDAARSTANSITGGGVRNMYINLNKFFDNLNINTTNLNAASNEVETKMTDLFLRILNSGGAITN